MKNITLNEIDTANLEQVTFGVELECHTDESKFDEVNGYHSAGKITRYDHPEFRGTKWGAERDASICCGYPSDGTPRRGVEFISPVLQGDEGIENVIAFVNNAKENWDARVNASCGVHVNIGLKAYTDRGDAVDAALFIAKLVQLSNYYSQVLWGQTGTLARENNTYCQPTPENCKREALDLQKKFKEGHLPIHADRVTMNGGGKYQMVNLSKVNNGQSAVIEFRCFAGSMNTLKLAHHIWTCIALCEVAWASRKKATTDLKYFSKPDEWETSEMAIEKFWHFHGAKAVFPAIRSRKDAIKATILGMCRKYDQRVARRNG